MQNELQSILEAVKRGELDIGDAAAKLSSTGFADLGFARVDHDREKRCGFPEVVFAESKTPQQVIDIMKALNQQHGHAFATRLKPDGFAAVKDAFPTCIINEAARTALIGNAPEPHADLPPVLIIAAGTSDLPVAEEAAESAAFARCRIERIYDAGVAGVHRLMADRSRFDECGAIIVVAGMEGALPSVVGGLTSSPVIAVPTSVGYGAALGGFTALFGMLTSCASGISVVNIDNGFGAAICAARILRKMRKSR